MLSTVNSEDPLGRLESLLRALVERETIKDWYSTEEFGRVIGKAEFTVREHCRLGRLNARKRQSGMGGSSGLGD
ncbi:hypothetical protein Sinac_1951 [Singulisphaera acidiphila DSM 18658]|uniref:Uncharacterized protein n=1 Tax=Singulisphaera acidiphila (strain ATCC BAA-1392 / DSM 18658 / VKM B-2454 / MOB10) TaxID=886293 RepID=L0DCB6_SINAD|nr:hypothetical protein Sinac_1951 [Singulisphaera acidiphila DSM 18658]